MQFSKQEIKNFTYLRWYSLKTPPTYCQNNNILCTQTAHLQRHRLVLLVLLKVTKWEYVTAGHDNNMVATKLWVQVPFRSQLQCNREQLSSVACNIKCQNTAVSTGADGRIENDSSVFPLEGKKLRRIHTPVRIGAVYVLTVQFLQVIICPAGEN